MKHDSLVRVLACLGALALGHATHAQATTNPSPTAKPAVDAGGWRSLGKTDLQWQRAGWWNDAVIYHMFIRSFKDSAEGPLAGDGTGDIRGIIEKLDYLNDARPSEGKATSANSLGVTGLWLMPIHPSPGYHGYEVADFYGVNPQYGTMDDFRTLVKECHARGIRVILDLVLNHISYTHPWFVEASKDPKSPKRDWFIWADKVPDWKGPWQEPVWWRVGYKPGDRQRPPAPGQTEGGPFYYGIFSPTMPDVNYRNTDASNAMLDAVKYWLQKEDVDGYRLDAIRHLVEDGPIQENTPETHEWLRLFHRTYKAARPDAFTVGEVWAPSEQIAPYVGDELDTCFEFNLQEAMVKGAQRGDATEVIALQKRVLELEPPGQYGRFLSNHDQTRVMTQLKGDVGAMRAAATMLLTGPGVPYIYYGEEIGMTGDKPDEFIRTPMQWTGGANGGFTTSKPWQALTKGYEQVNVEAEEADPTSLLSLYKKLLRVRSAHPSLRWGGTVLGKASTPEVLVMLRTADDRPAGGTTNERALVVINLAPYAIDGCAISLPAGAVPGDATLTGDELLNASLVRDGRAEGDGSVKAWAPIPHLAPRTGYVIVLK